MKKQIHSGSLKQELSEREKRHSALARRTAAEGIAYIGAFAGNKV